MSAGWTYILDGSRSSSNTLWCRINGEKERLSILKSEVDGEDTHLKELRKVAEAEFGALQKNVEGLAKKANCVKEDIAEKRLIVERLKDKIGHLEDVKSGTQNDHEEQGMRYEKELGRLRSEIGRTEEQVRGGENPSEE